MPPLVLLACAILFEVAGTVMLRLSDGMSKLVPAVAAIVFYGAALCFLALVIKRIDLGVTYAAWAGAGTAIVAVIGVLVWHEPVNALKVASILAVIAGVIGLNLSGSH